MCKLEKKILETIDSEFDKCVNELCKDSYYKNLYLQYAFQKHTSPQCIIRTYAEMLKSGYKYTRNANDLFHANLLVERLRMLADTELINFLNECLDNLQCKCQKAFPYLIVDAPGRIKSFKSFEAKCRTNILLSEISRELLKQVPNMGFSSNEESMTSKFITEFIQDTSQSCTQDMFGLRLIVYYVDKKIDENTLAEFISGKFALFCQRYFEEMGFNTIEVTDYISEPKENGYQSFHFKVYVMGIYLEVQIRSNQMHQKAESGSASHSKYKDTVIQNFVKDFLYQISGDKITVNEKLGLLKEQTLRPTTWCFIPGSEVPKTPTELKKFADKSILENIFSQD